MFIRILFFVILFKLYLFSDTNTYPKLFYKMGEPLFSVVSKLDRSTSEKDIRELIEKYKVNVDKTIEIGLNAEKVNSSNKNKKEYLFALRKLQKDYDFILNKLRKKLLTSILESNHKCTREILNSDISRTLLKKQSVLNPILDYYKKYKKLGDIAVLNQIIKNQKHTLETPSDYEILVSNGRFINHGRYITDTKTGLHWQRNGAESGRLNFYQAKKYADNFSTDNLEDWRLPTVKELQEVNRVKNIIPFIYPEYLHDKTAFWSSEMNYELDDYAYLFIWPRGNKKGGQNGCYASKNWYYVLSVHDPVR